jgi:thioredoxin-like negative regulator of GroEL
MRLNRAALAAAFLSTCALAQPLVGPSVGSADAFLAEGNRLYNERQFAEASARFLSATRANPSLLDAYLGYARSRLQVEDVAVACGAYRVWLKAAPPTSINYGKVQEESQLCEKKKAALSPPPADPAAAFVKLKAQFYTSLEKRQLLGENGAAEALRALGTGGYLGLDLGDMAQKLRSAALGQADATVQKALARAAVPVEQLREVRVLYELAGDLGEPGPQAASRGAFAEGTAELQSGDPKRAQGLFTEALDADGSLTEARFLRAMASWRAGDKEAALAALEKDLPADPRTQVLRAALAAGRSAPEGAAQLEELLFRAKFQGGR